MKDKTFWTIALSSIVTLVLTLLAVTIMDNRGFLKRKDVNTINAYVEEIRKNYYTDVTDEELKNNIYHSLFRVDKYSDYLDTEEFDKFMNKTDDFVGIGIYVVQRSYDNKVKVADVYPNSPASKADIYKDDIIVAIDDVNIEYLSLDEISGMLRGEPDTDVKVTLVRENDTLEKTITRKALEYELVSSTMYDDIQYIKIYEFFGDVADQFKQELNPNAKGLVIDLRNNTGGDVDIMIKVISSILSKDELVTYTVSKDDVRVDYNTIDGQCVSEELPIILLVNENTASAAEMMTACLMDYNRVKVIGNTTYGKGVVQTLITEGNIGFKLTTDIWYSPNGNCVDQVGIKPDILEEDVDNQLILALDKIKED